MYDLITYNTSLLTDDELQQHVANREKYLPETTEASIAELQKRGHLFSEEELTVIHQDIQTQRENAALPYKGIGRINGNHKNAIVEDPAAPKLYSRRAVYYFSIFMGALFGSIMLAINSGTQKNPFGVFLCIFFGIAFTTVQVWGFDYVNKMGGSYQIMCGLISGLIADYLLWPKIIGNSTFYRTRPIWAPLIIGLLFLALIITALLIGQGQP